MAETLESYLARQFRDVAEDGKSTRTIRLVVAESGQTWERWDSPLRESEGGPGVQKIADEIVELSRSYKEGFPAGAVVMMAVVAEDASGNERARHLIKVTGENKQAKSTLLGGDTSQAEANKLFVETCKTLLQVQSSQITVMGTQIKTLLETIQTLALNSVNADLKNAEDAKNKVAQGEQLDPHTKFVLEKLAEIAEPFAKYVGPSLAKSLAGAPAPAPPPPPIGGPNN